MNLRSRRPPNAPLYLPSELIADVLSFLPVKSIIRFRCVNNTFNSLISDPTFVKLHLNRSARNDDHKRVYKCGWRDFSFTVFRIFENPAIVFDLPEDPYYQLEGHDCDRYDIVGSCNGLICLLGHRYNPNYIVSKKWLRIWNPATRTISKKIWCRGIEHFNLRFGYDNSTNTYKVLHFIPDTKKVRVLTLGNNVWRKIQNSPVTHDHSLKFAFMSGSVNWLTMRRYYSFNYCENITIEEFAIISLDLSTETYTELRPPPGLNEIPLLVEPDLSVLKDCLCLSHYLEETHLIIWQMKEFGVEESWIQFLKISYDNLLLDIHFCYFELLLLRYSERTDKLFFTNYLESQAVICNRRYNRVERMNKVEGIYPSSLLSGHNHVESLVWYC